jgi:hypothetical protein
MSNVFERQICECGLVLLTADEHYNHLYKTGHKVRNTPYRLEDYYLIEQKLNQWKLELPSAVEMLKGSHLEDFKKLIYDVYILLKIEVTDTGTFIKSDG